VLARTLDAKDAYTQGHSYRVSELCVLMARKLRVAPEIVENLRNGALLHDVGKIGIPDAILCKPGRLTDEEFAIMKQHPVIGYEICQSLGLGEEILMLIRNHHEKLDGTGYPDGLKLNEIPLPLRIICVADAFDAMSSSRPYRKVMDAHIRNEQLNRFAGTQFDPVVVETLKTLLSSGALDELYKEHWQTSTETAALPNDPGSDLDIILFKAA
jgi:putative nucleotidyltransferase with HDIG domain